MMELKYDFCRCMMAVGLTITLAACSDHVIDATNEGTNATSTYEFNAYIDAGNSTRTSMGELKDGKYPVVWSEGDKVFLFASSGESYDATLLSGSGTQKAIFKGGCWYLPAWDGYFCTSVYPFEGAKASRKYTYAGSSRGYELTITANLPHVQTYQTGTFANNVFPMIGLCTNQYDFYYENMAGVLQLPVKGTGKISKIVLTGNDNETLAGEFTMNCTCYQNAKIDYWESKIAEADKEAACGRLIKPVSDKSTGIITIDCGKDGLQLDPTTPTMINIAMLPKTFKKGFSVQFIDYDNGGSFMKSTTEPITVKRSYVKTMQEFDYTKPEPLEPANCYVVDKAGYYLIPAFCMGNRPKSARLKVDENGLDSINHHKVAADYLWTDTPGAVSQIEYIPGKDGYISFKVNPDKAGNAPRGNTVVALYDSETKEILWSWHIWMSEYNEVATNGQCSGGVSTADGFTSDKTEGHLIIMDRNLGATSANKNDGWKTYGLYYQMGRKDPFVGANSAGGDDECYQENYLDKNHSDQNISTYNLFEAEKFGAKTNHTEWNTNLTNGWTYNKDYITAIYAYKNPMEFASSWNKNNDTRWTIKDLNKTEPFVSNGDHEDFWNRTKTINDPCPAGWTILGERNGEFHDGDFKKDTTSFYTENGVYGIEVKYYFKNSSETSTVWWPASGFRSVDGTIGNLGQGGYYWYYDHIGAEHGGHGWSFIKVTKQGKDKDNKKYTYSIYETKNNSDPMTNHACVVRCVKAKQTQE